MMIHIREALREWIEAKTRQMSMKVSHVVVLVERAEDGGIFIDPDDAHILSWHESFEAAQKGLDASIVRRVCQRKNLPAVICEVDENMRVVHVLRSRKGGLFDV